MSGELKIDGEVMQGIVSKAILEGIGEEQKLSLVEQAIQYLITAPPSVGYGSRPEPTPLQVAFNAAVQQASYKVVGELVKDEMISTAIDEGIRKALVNDLSQGSDEWLRDSIVDAISQKVADVFRKERGW